MKIRTDFVTNSSSSSFVTINAKSSDLAKFLKERMDEIEENNDGYCDVEINIDGDEVLIESGDRDMYFDNPEKLDQVIPLLLNVCRLEAYDEVETKLTNSLESVSWSYEVWGLDGDDGRFDRSNYDPDVLEELLSEIAECNDCTVNEVTDEMFNDYVAPDSGEVTEEETFDYSKADGICKYYYNNGMHRVSKEYKVSADATKKLSKIARAIKKTVDALSEEQYNKIVAECLDDIATVSKKKKFSSRDEFSSLLAKSLDKHVPYFFDNYFYGFVPYVQKEISADVPVLTREELAKFLDDKIEI